MKPLARTALSVVLALASSGCAFLTRPIVGVDRVGVEPGYAERTRWVLDGGELSEPTRSLLATYELDALADEEPERALGLLHHRATVEPRRGTLFALAELSAWMAARSGRAEEHLASAVYAQLFLFGWEAPTAPDPYDRRFRQALDLYERGLTEALRAPSGEELALEARTWELPTGRLVLDVDGRGFAWDPARFRFLPAADYRTWGFKWRPRDSGVGVPLIAVAEGYPADRDRLELDAPPTNTVAATLVLELDGGLRAMARGLRGRLELHDQRARGEAELAGRRVPLEQDIAAALGYGARDERLWDYSVSGFFAEGELRQGLTRLTPYTPGRVPVVFVHGTASSPGYWAETINSLWADRELRERTQTWVFTYSTGSPILYSAAKLRAALREAVHRLDPGGDDPALRQMVLVGHSQGGLLVRLMVVHGDESWWEEAHGAPLSDFDFAPEDEALIRRSLVFEPLREVSRAVFVSTPHRGSFVAGKGIAHLVARLVKLPGEVQRLIDDLRRDDEPVPGALAGEVGTSVADMDPSNPFSQRLAATRIAPWVRVHSIVSVSTDGDPTLGDDGVVEYRSAHLDEADSELIVPSSHSCQGHPRTILELRRILRLATDLPAAPTQP